MKQPNYNNFYYTLGFLVWLIIAVFCLRSNSNGGQVDPQNDFNKQYESCDSRRC